MEKLFFELPSINRKDEIIDYINEHVKYNSPINGRGDLDKILEGYTFEQALERTLNMADETYAASLGKCPGITFLLIRDSDNKIIGTSNLRWNLPEEMLKFNGHIGYGIRPTERRKGYNKINLYLTLLEAKKLGLNKVMISCAVDNIGSDKTIQDLGGILSKSEIDPNDNILTNVYWIDVNDSIEKYSQDYENKILHTNKKGEELLK